MPHVYCVITYSPKTTTAHLTMSPTGLPGQMGQGHLAPSQTLKNGNMTPMHFRWNQWKPGCVTDESPNTYNYHSTPVTWVIWFQAQLYPWFSSKHMEQDLSRALQLNRAWNPQPNAWWISSSCFSRWPKDNGTTVMRSCIGLTQRKNAEKLCQYDEPKQHINELGKQQHELAPPNA